MKRSPTIIGLDIGTAKIAAVAGYVEETGVIRIVGHADGPSRGIVRGALVDVDAAVGSVTKVLRETGKAGRFRPPVYASISGEGLRIERAKGMVPISVRGREITHADVKKCIDAASTIQLPFDREVIHRIVQQFTIDDQTTTVSPVGLYASRLACEISVVSASVNQVQNIYKCVHNAGFDLDDVVFSGLADGSVLLDDEERQTGAMIVNVGAGTSVISLYRNGRIADMEIVPCGSADIGKPVEECQALKRIAAAITTMISQSAGGHSLPRMVKIAGGIVFIDGVIEQLEGLTSMKMESGTVKNISGTITSSDSYKYMTAIGIVKYAYAKKMEDARSAKNIFHDVINKIVDTFNNYF